MKAPDDEPESRQSNPVGFASTHWGMVITAADSTAPQSEQALNNLCGAYWPPVYAHIRRQGQNAEDALDLAQERLLQDEGLVHSQ